MRVSLTVFSVLFLASTSYVFADSNRQDAAECPDTVWEFFDSISHKRKSWSDKKVLLEYCHNLVTKEGIESKDELEQYITDCSGTDDCRKDIGIKKTDWLVIRDEVTRCEGWECFFNIFFIFDLSNFAEFLIPTLLSSLVAGIWGFRRFYRTQRDGLLRPFHLRNENGEYLSIPGNKLGADTRPCVWTLTATEAGQKWKWDGPCIRTISGGKYLTKAENGEVTLCDKKQDDEDKDADDMSQRWELDDGYLKNGLGGLLTVIRGGVLGLRAKRKHKYADQKCQKWEQVYDPKCSDETNCTPLLNHDDMVSQLLPEHKFPQRNRCLIQNVATGRYLLDPADKKPEKASGGWSGSENRAVMTDANNGDRVVWSVNKESLKIISEKTNRMLFDSDVNHKNEKEARINNAIMADANYYNLANWKMRSYNNVVIFENGHSKGFLYDCGEDGDDGSETVQTVFDVDPRFDRRSQWRVLDPLPNTK